MRYSSLLIVAALAAITLFTFPAFAADSPPDLAAEIFDATNATDAPTVTQAPGLNLWQALIPLIVPGLIALVKVFVPKIPKLWLPVLAPVFGAAAQIALHYAGLAEGGAVLGAVLGAAGVALRESFHQSKKALDRALPAHDAYP